MIVNKVKLIKILLIILVILSVIYFNIKNKNTLYIEALYNNYISISHKKEYKWLQLAEDRQYKKLKISLIKEYRLLLPKLFNKLLDENRITEYFIIDVFKNKLVVNTSKGGYEFECDFSKKVNKSFMVNNTSIFISYEKGSHFRCYLSDTTNKKSATTHNLEIYGENKVIFSKVENKVDLRVNLFLFEPKLNEKRLSKTKE